MDSITFIFLNLVMIGAFVYALENKRISYLMYLVSGLFSMILVLALHSGVNYCCDTTKIVLFSGIITGFLTTFYLVSAIGSFVLGVTDIADKNFKGEAIKL